MTKFFGIAIVATVLVLGAVGLLSYSFPLNLTGQVVGTGSCMPVIASLNGANDSRINVVFVFINYNLSRRQSLSLRSFASEIAFNNTYALTSVEPFASNRGKFNFYFVNSIGNVSNYESGDGKHGQEANVEINRLSVVCDVPNKQVVAFVEWYFTSFSPRDGLARVHLGSPSYPYSVRGMDDISTNTMHEFGHAFGRLKDEYANPDRNKLTTSGNAQCFYSSEPSASTTTSITTFIRNCQHLEFFSNGTRTWPGYQECELVARINESVRAFCETNAPWSDLIGNGCGAPGIVDCNSSNPAYELEETCLHSGCYIGSNVIRHSLNTIMRNHYRGFNVFSYGSQNQRLICRKIREKIGSAEGVCRDLCLDSCSAGNRCIRGNCVRVS